MINLGEHGRPVPRYDSLTSTKNVYGLQVPLVAKVENVSAEPKGLGGWLILIAISLIWSTIDLTLGLFYDFLPIFQEGRWHALTTPGTEEYHPLWGPVLGFELIGNTIILIFSFALIIFFFSKSFRFPALFITYLIVNLLGHGIDFFLGDLIPAVATKPDSQDLHQLLQTLILALVLIPSFMMSERVKNTFVKKDSFPLIRKCL